MDTSPSLNTKSMMLWSFATVLFVGLIAEISQPPCDKPVNCESQRISVTDQDVAKPEDNNQQDSLPVQWDTSEGIRVSHFFRPSASELVIQLLLESMPEDGESIQQTIEIKLMNARQRVPDTQDIRLLVDSLSAKYRPVKVSITIEGSLEEQQAREVAELLSQAVYPDQTAVSSPHPD